MNNTKNSKITIPTITGDNFDVPVAVFETKNTSNKIQEIVNNWIVKKGGRHWPEILTSDVLSADLKKLYIALWVISGASEGIWSASIGIPEEYTDTCGRCFGTGMMDDIITSGSFGALIGNKGILKSILRRKRIEMEQERCLASRKTHYGN